MSEKSEKLLSTKQLADVTGLTMPFIEKARRRLDLPFYKLGGIVRFKLSEYEIWLKQRKSAS